MKTISNGIWPVMSTPFNDGKSVDKYILFTCI